MKSSVFILDQNDSRALVEEFDETQLFSGAVQRNAGHQYPRKPLPMSPSECSQTIVMMPRFVQVAENGSFEEKYL